MSGLIGSGFFLVLIIAVVMVFGSSLDCVGKMSA